MSVRHRRDRFQWPLTLVPEVNKPHSLGSGIVQFGAFVLGMALLQLVAALDR